MATATLDPPSTLPVVESPIQPEPGGEIPLASIQPAGRDFPDDLWLNLANVPVFAEHSTQTKGGKQLTFGRRELAAVCANCNRRIRETGDYAGIIVGHTPDPDAGQQGPDKALVGLAGPFRMGLIQQPGGQAKWAILADFHVNRKHASVIEDYPRRSPELWVEDSYAEMYLDPIALLGAEAPRLDMGLLYSARRARDGKQVEKYSACAPSATGVFVPDADATATSRPKQAAQPEQYAADEVASNPQESKESAMALSPEDLSQIVQAIEQTDWAQWVRTKMQADTPADQPPAKTPDNPEQFAAENEPPTTPAPPVTPEPPATPVVDPSMAAPPAVTAPPPVPDPNDPLPVKYSRLSGEVGTLRQTVDALKSQLDHERALRVNTERYAALAERRRSRMFDLNAEFETLRYGKATDEQFAAHVKCIDENYREIPLDTNVPTFDGPGAFGPRPGGKVNKERYSKEASDQALKIAKAKAMRGEPASYEEELEKIVNGEG